MENDDEANERMSERSSTAGLPLYAVRCPTARSVGAYPYGKGTSRRNEMDAQSVSRDRTYSFRGCP